MPDPESAINVYLDTLSEDDLSPTEQDSMSAINEECATAVAAYSTGSSATSRRKRQLLRAMLALLNLLP